MNDVRLDDMTLVSRSRLIDLRVFGAFVPALHLRNKCPCLAVGRKKCTKYKIVYLRSVPEILSQGSKFLRMIQESMI